MFMLIKNGNNWTVVVKNQNLIGLRLMLTTEGNLVSLTNLPCAFNWSIVLTNEV